MGCFVLFEHTLWDLKPASINSFFASPSGLNIPYGIWNPTTSPLISSSVLFEHTLWDLKRWASLNVRCLANLFEHTLWDLKLNWTKTWACKIWLSLNIPYGIWNQQFKEHKTSLKIVWTYPMGFETASANLVGQLALFEHTLWDLKHFLKWCENRRTCVWTYPMGFETLSQMMWK